MNLRCPRWRNIRVFLFVRRIFREKLGSFSISTLLQETNAALTSWDASCRYIWNRQASNWMSYFLREGVVLKPNLSTSSVDSIS